MKNLQLRLLLIALVLGLVGCGSQSVPQAHKGKRFDRTGAAALWSNPTGFQGDILGPGTYYTGMYGGLRTVQCGQATPKETLNALTKDGVQFSLDVYIRMSAKCDANDSVTHILETLSPAGPSQGDPAKGIPASDGRAITTGQLYSNYIRPAIGEAVRAAVSPYVANDINAQREKIFKQIQSDFMKSIKDQKPEVVTIYEVKLSNLNFPEKLEKANVDRAEQAILKDKAIAEREKVKAETETAAAKMNLEKRKAENEAVKISTIGEALRQNPAYMEYQMLMQLPGIYRSAGSSGNLVITAPNPGVFVSPKGK